MSTRKTIKNTIKTRDSEFRTQMATIDGEFMKYQALVMLRTRAASGAITDELYKFLNVNGSLESMFIGLPLKSQVPTGALESLQAAQLAYLDNAIEGVVSGIKNLIQTLLSRFASYIKDWVITNNRLKFYLQRNITRLDSRISDYGDPRTFDIATGPCYARADWVKMLEKSIQINRLMANVDAEHPAKYFIAHHREFSEAFVEFGYRMTDTSIVKDDPRYLIATRPLGSSGGRWVRDSLANDCRAAMNNLVTDANNSRMIRAVSAALKRASTTATDINDLRAMEWLVGMCRVSELCSGVVARGVLGVCTVAKRNA